MDPFSWVCPHCEHAATITDSDYARAVHRDDHVTALGTLSVSSTLIVCPNPDCKLATVDVALRSWKEVQKGGKWVYEFSEPLSSWRLAPVGPARRFPDYVPEAIRADYEEACSIRDLSPKASATLARRAVQGIIRDFWDVVRPTLKQEIDALQDRAGKDIPVETWEGIDAVRSIGNIGAHMEKDINVIIDVDADEATTLIELIESLIADTYVARKKRAEHHDRLMAIKNAKAAAKAAAPPAQTPQKP